MAIVVTTMPEDIAVAMGRSAESLDNLERAHFQRWIDDAALLISQKVADDAVIDANVLDYVIRQAVVAVAQGPQPNVSSESVQVDDASLTTRYVRAARRVSILPEWWAMLGVSGSGRAFSVDMAGARTAHRLWCDLAFAGATCSCGADIAGYPIYEGPSWML